MANVVLFGGSGFIGRYIVPMLCKNGHVLRIITRNPKKAEHLKVCGNVGQVSLVCGDIFNKSKIPEYVGNADIIINLVGAVHQQQKSFYELHVGWPSSLASFIKNNKSDLHMIHFSAGTQDPEISDYTKTKYLGEQRVLNLLPGATIIRPDVVFGREDVFFNTMLRIANKVSYLPLINQGASIVNPIYVEDIARFVVQIISLEKKGYTFNIAGPETFCFREAMDKIFSLREMKVKYLNLPKLLAYILALFNEIKFVPLLFKPLTGNSDPIITRDQISLLYKHNNNFSNDLTSVDIKPSYFYETIQQYIFDI